MSLYGAWLNGLISFIVKLRTSGAAVC